MSSFQKPTGPKRIALLVFGDGKVGKSQAALTFPKPAMIDYEGDAAEWFADRYDFMVAKAKTFADGEKLFPELRNGEFKTLIEDSVTAPHYRLMNANADDTGNVNKQAWPRIKQTERSHMIRARDCGLHYVATAREKVEYYKAGEVMKNGNVAKGTEFAPKAFVPDFDEDIIHEFDLVIRLFKENGKYLGEVTQSRSDKLPAGKVLQDVTFQLLVKLIKGNPEDSAAIDRAIDKAHAEVGASKAELFKIVMECTRGKTNNHREASDDEKRAILALLTHFQKAVPA